MSDGVDDDKPLRTGGGGLVCSPYPFQLFFSNHFDPEKGELVLQIHIKGIVSIEQFGIFVLAVEWAEERKQLFQPSPWAIYEIMRVETCTRALP